MLDLMTTRGRIVAGALKLAAERPWSDVTLADIAKEANLSLFDLRREFDSKAEILAAFVRAIDDEVLARAPERTTGETSRDALFEVVMSRFDVLAAYRSALKSIAAAWSLDPALLGALAASQAWMLRAAGISADGLEGQVRTAGLAAVYASVFRTWLEDDDPGLARTMAALDRRLRRGEETLKSIEEITGKLRGLASFVTSARKPAGAERAAKGASEGPPAASA
jgi:AcrR family transcriptional regulator